MSFRRSVRSDRPVDRAESDRLLDAARAGLPAGADAAATEPLARLLSAAAGPAGPGELAGERETLAAFRAARAGSAPVPAPVRSPRRRGLTAGAVAWIAGLAATATAGAAFAAVTLDRPEAPARPTAPATTPTDQTPGGSPSRTGGGAPTGGAPTAPGPSTGADPTTGKPGKAPGTAELPGLCRAYLAKPVGQRERALETPGFAPLVPAAGGADQVDAYCRRLVQESDRGGASETPAAAPKATGSVPASAGVKPSTGTGG